MADTSIVAVRAIADSWRGRCWTFEEENKDLKDRVAELTARIHELEPCHRCSDRKSGSYGKYCEECHFVRLDRACQELGLLKWVDTTDEMALAAFQSRCKAFPHYKDLYRECYERVTRRSVPY